MAPPAKPDDDEKADALKAMEEIQAKKEKHPTVRPYETRKVEIGHINGVPEVKIEWEGKWIKYPVIYHRNSKLVAYAEFAAPDLHTIWGDITGCAAGAAAVATLAAIIASPAAASGSPPLISASMVSSTVALGGTPAMRSCMRLACSRAPAWASAAMNAIRPQASTGPNVFLIDVRVK